MDNSPSAINPYNDLPTIRLLAQDGGELGLVSQRAAGKLLRLARADLLLELPPAVRTQPSRPKRPFTG